MKILIDVGHPSHVHLFKNAIWILMEKGHEIKITARDKDITLGLLDVYNFDYDIAGISKKGSLNKALNIIKIEYSIYKASKTFKPDIFVGASGNFYVTHVAKLFGKPSIVFEDSEPDSFVFWLGKHFASFFCTPEGFNRKLPHGMHIKYKGYKELAYLHPNNFRPDVSVLKEIGLSNGEKFTLFRFVSWSAGHDIGRYGLNLEMKREFVNQLKKYGKVFISSESKLPPEFEKYKLTIPSHKIHDLLSYAHMFVGDSQTMATEASVLGIPTIRSNSFVGTMSNFKELEKKYELMYSFKDPEQALNKALELQEDNDLKQKWEIKRKKLLAEKIDVTAFIVNLIENYPQSCEELLATN